MNFGEAKSKAVEALKTGLFSYEFREHGKNVVADGDLSQDQAAAIVSSVRGQEASSSEDHLLCGVQVWVFRPPSWYIKFYSHNGVVFISFHKSGG